MSQHEHDVVIIGGGIAGLSAAWELRDLDVVLLESEDRVGGRLRSQSRGPNWLVAGAHFLSHPDSPLGRMAAETGLDTLPVSGKMTALWMKGKLLDKGSVFTYPFRLPLSLGGRISLMRTGLKLLLANRRVVAKSGDPTHQDVGYDGAYVETAGDEALDECRFDELLGALHPDVAAIMQTASQRLGTESGKMSANFAAGIVGNICINESAPRYTLKGGLEELARALGARLDNRVVTNTRTVSVSQSNERVLVRTIQGGKEETVRAKYAIVATPAPIVRQIVDDLPADKAQALDALRYGSLVVMAVRTGETEPMPYDDIYAIGIVGRTAYMLFNTMNPMRGATRARQPGGTLTLHAGGDHATRLLGLDDAAITAELLGDLYAVLPHTQGLVEETWIQRWPLGIAYWPPGRLKLQEALAGPFGKIYFAGDYVGHLSTGPTAHSAQLAARVIRSELARATDKPVVAPVVAS